MTETQTSEIALVGLSDEGDLFATIRQDDLIEALQIAVDSLDEVGSEYDAETDARRTRLLAALAALA